MWKLFYFANVVDALRITLGWLVALSFILFIITLIWRLIYRFDYSYNIDSEKDVYGELNKDRLQYFSLCKLNRIGIVLCILFMILRVITPCKNTIYLMAGGKLVDLTIENNPQIKEVPGKTIDLLNAWLEKETGELRPEKEIKENTEKVGE